MHVKCNKYYSSNILHNNILIITMHHTLKMFTFIYFYSLQQPFCIMVTMVLLRCYQYHRCYDHIWAANCKVFQGNLCLEGDPYYIFILQYLQICPCTMYTRYKHICNDLSFYSFKVIFTIYLFYNLYRCIIVLSCTKYKHINNDLFFIIQGDLYYIFILHSLHLCTGYTE